MSANQPLRGTSSLAFLDSLESEADDVKSSISLDLSEGIANWMSI